MLKRVGAKSLLFPYKHFYNHHYVGSHFPPIYVISRGKVCPDLISTLDSNPKERIPGVCVSPAGRRDAPPGPDSRNIWQSLSWAELGERTMVGGWLVWPWLARTAQVILPCSHRPRPGMPHEYMSVEVRTSEWGHAHLLTVHCESTSCHWQPLNCTQNHPQWVTLSPKLFKR